MDYTPTPLLRTLALGYLPTLGFAIIGNLTLGGSVVWWIAFAWLVGAAVTVIVALFLTIRVPQDPSQSTVQQEPGMAVPTAR